MNAIKKGLNTAFNFDDIVDTQLDDIKTVPIKNSANTVKYKWLYPKLALLVSKVLNEQDLELTIEEQNTLFEDCIKCNVYYLFPDNDPFQKFIIRYSNINLKANLNWIDTSNITDMSWIFGDSEFDGDISQWDVSNVTDMWFMFYYSEFNGDINNWDVSHVTNMRCMFAHSTFNRDISSWDVSNVLSKNNIFDDCPIKEEYKPKI